MIDKIRRWYRTLPDKKVYFELVAAILTIPVLISVILLNTANLQDKDKSKDVTPTPAQTQNTGAITVIPVEISREPQKSPNPSCRKEIGPVNVKSPQEGQVISSDPVCIDVSYTAGEYCSVEWSVRVNEGTWSDFSDKDICLYTMASGKKRVEVRVRSTQSSQEITLQRSFEYIGQVTPTTVATDSAH